MPARNIHGQWSMVLEGRVLKSEIVGSTNSEASFAWFEELKSNLLSSPEGISTPWVICIDCRQWEGSSQDNSDAHHIVTDWAKQNNAVMCAFVISKKITVLRN